MRYLQEHERFEMQTLDVLRRGRFLDNLVFGGGTMLRLCHRLPRYSVDLDFYLRPQGRDFSAMFSKMAKIFAGTGIEISDQAEKHFTWLIELKSPAAPRRLKIEIRKDDAGARDRETGIAHSIYVPELQVRLNTCTLAQMFINKVRALVGRREIRDAYDLEFLLMRGAGDFSTLNRDELEQVRSAISGFSNQDYSSKLGGLLLQEERNRITETRFSFLTGMLNETIAKTPRG